MVKMKSKFKLDNYNNVNATLELTMTVYEWKLLGKQLAHEYPAWRVEDAIGKMLSKYFTTLEEELKIDIE
jgi:hypothetical protein